MSVEAVPELSPAVAAKLADAVYGIREVDDPARGAAERGVTGLEAAFELADGRIATATYDSERTAARSEAAQDRFDRLSSRPPKDDRE